MKKFLVLTSILSLLNFALNADEFKVSNKFKGQIYVTVISGDDMKNTLISGNGTSSILYDEEIDKIMINFQHVSYYYFFLILVGFQFTTEMLTLTLFYLIPME